MKIEYEQTLPDSKYCNGCKFIELIKIDLAIEEDDVCEIARVRPAKRDGLIFRPQECIDKFGK